MGYIWDLHVWRFTDDPKLLMYLARERTVTVDVTRGTTDTHGPNTPGALFILSSFHVLMRHFQLPSADPLFQQESLQLLTDMEMGYEPALAPELRDYVAAQAPFIVKEASEYRSNAANWPVLLAAGQRAFVEIWQQCQANMEKLPIFIQSDVVQAMRTVAAQQLTGHTASENLMSWAREAGESEAVAAAFAAYHRAKSTEYEQDMADSLTQLRTRVPTDAEDAADLQEELAEVEKATADIPAKVLSRAWAYIEKYKVALAKGHSAKWADAYARHFDSTDNEAASEREAYHDLRQQHPNPKTETLPPGPGAKPYPPQAWVNQAVYKEAYAVRLDRGPDYADAYARTVGLGEYNTAEAYAEAFVEQCQAGKSELFADYYALEVSSDKEPVYALLEAELYEQAPAGGMAEGWARDYADRLSTKLIEYAENDEDREYYTQEVAEYIARKQREAREGREDEDDD